MSDITFKNFANGINQQASATNTPDGYVRSILNMDTVASGQLTTRTGYEGVFGSLPLRVVKIERSNGIPEQYKITFNGIVNVLNSRPSPIVLAGRLGYPVPSTNPHNYNLSQLIEDEAHYFPTYTSSSITTLSIGNNSLTLSQDDHNLATQYIFTGISKLDNGLDNSNTQLIPGTVSIDTSYNVSIDYVANAVESAFVYFADKSAVPGTTYIQSASAVTSIVVDATTHALSNNFIYVRCFDTTGSAFVETMPQSVEIATNGEVTIEFSDAFTGDVVLSCVPVENAFSTSVTGLGTQTITIPNPGSPYNFVSAYYFSGSTYTQIIPSSVSYDEPTNSLIISLILSLPAETIEVYWENASVVSSSITVDLTGYPAIMFGADGWGDFASFVDEQPELVVYGIPHAGLYEGTAKGGFTHHIDHYQRAGEARLIAGIGGNIYGAYTRAEKGNQYKMGALQINARGRVDGDFVVGPLFAEPGTNSARTRGSVEDPTVVDNMGLIVSAVTSGGYTDYEFSFTNKVGTVTLTPGRDYLTVAGTPYKQLNGEFLIDSIVVDDPDRLVVRCYTGAADRMTFSVATARGGVFTDVVEYTGNLNLMPGDKLKYSGQPMEPEVGSVTASDFFIKGITSDISLTDGLRIGLERTSHVVPTADLIAVASVKDVVVGDRIYSARHGRSVEVIGIIGASVSVSGVGDGTALTLTASGAHGLYEGQKILLNSEEVYGEFTITGVPTSTTFTVDSSYTGSISACEVVGPALELAEALTLADRGTDTDRLVVEGRWIPLSCPYIFSNPIEPNNFSQLSTNKIAYFPADGFGNNRDIRSVLAQDTLYLTNGADPVRKFDGTHLLPAGLPRWQPWAFSTVDTTTGSLVASSVSIDFDTYSGNVFQMASGDELKAGIFRVGNRIADENGVQYIVTEVNIDVGFIEVNKPISGSFSTKALTRVNTYRCYFRLNLIDKNNNIIASAPSSHLDCVMDVGTSGQLVHKIINVPPFDTYDYDRMELEYYRTKANEVFPFYKVRSIAASTSIRDGAVVVRDGIPDDTLTELDSTQSRFEADLGVNWAPPPVAACLTTSDNRLILGNIVGPSTFDITFAKQSGADSITAANFHNKLIKFKKDIETSDSFTVHNYGTVVPETAFQKQLNFQFRDIASSSPIAINTIGLALGYTLLTSTTPSDIKDGLIPGSWVYLYHSSDNPNRKLDLCGWHRVYDFDANGIILDIPYNASFSTTNHVDRVLKPSAAQAGIPVPLGADYNWGDREGQSSGSYEGIAAKRLATCINFVTRESYRADSFTSGQELKNYRPWLSAFAGSIYGNGTVQVVVPAPLETSPSLIVPAAIGNCDVFVNQIKRAASSEVPARQFFGPSRLLLSMPNQTEVFDLPFGPEVLSGSALDINAADGQPVVALTTFFGSSTFGGAQLNSIVVVFKENSIYVVDPASKQYQKVDSRGLGCTAPKSVVPTKDGIMFANNSGIFRLNRDLSIVPLGMALGDLWSDPSIAGDITEAAGHNYQEGRKFKLSMPTGYTFVSDHDSEVGAWSLYDNHNATGWTNLSNKAYFSTTDGKVMRVKKNTGLDYRDDGQPIRSEVLFRAEDFGVPGLRKVITNASIDLAPLTPLSEVLVSSRTDLNSSFDQVASISTSSATHVNSRLSLPGRRGNFVQMKVSHGELDQALSITGLHFKVTPLSQKGMKESSDFS